MNKLIAKNINVWYGDNHALKDVSMVIEPNQVTSLIGPSGCGKSTFLRLFNRMNDYIDNFKLGGEILINDQNIYDPSVNTEELRKKVGMVFQKPNPFPSSIYENVAFGLRIQGMKKKSQIDEIVESSLRKAVLWDEVKDSLKKSAYSLSGGQQQRLCIARTLAVEPEIILMDEPASALDPISTSKLENLITELKKNYTIVIVTHNMQQAGRVSDMTAFFFMGSLIEYDTTRTMFLKPQHLQTQNYITGRFG
jgi:phosphate transport system ATP-binding protein